MRLPPWAIEAIRNGVADVARKASDAETIAKVKDQAAELLRDLPENASRGIDTIVKTATEKARSALDQGRESILRWRERQTDLAVRCLNVQGVFLSGSGTGVPVSDHVLQLGCDILRGDCLIEGLSRRLDESISKLLDIDAHSVAVANNFDAAIAALRVLAADRTMVMHRSQAIRLPSGTPLPDALSGITLQEVGGVQTIEPSDFDAINQACVLLADDGTHAIEPIDFGRRDVLTIALLPIATIKQNLDAIPSAESLLHAGVDLVVLPAGPLTGGTTAGIIAGKKDLVQRIEKDRCWKAYAASDATRAMTLAAMTAPQSTSLSVLIETGVENLHSRAQRMATRLSADESITQCQVSETPALIVRGGRWEFPSRQLRLRHKTLSAESWREELKRQNPAVLAVVDGQDLVVDFRWLPASEDAFVAEALGSNDNEPESDGGSDPAGETPEQADG